MNTLTLDQAPSNTIQELLEKSGFQIHGRRADCPHCEGHSRLTVSFTDEVAFCHRCKWTGNVRTLSRALALPVARETTEHREARIRARQFEQWRDTCQRILTDRLRQLCRKADSAVRVLALYPDCEPAWNALQAFYDCEAELCTALDLLSYEKNGPWLETPMTNKILAAAFDEACKCGGKETNAA